MQTPVRGRPAHTSLRMPRLVMLPELLPRLKRTRTPPVVRIDPHAVLRAPLLMDMASEHPYVRPHFPFAVFVYAVAVLVRTAVLARMHQELRFCSCRHCGCRGVLVRIEGFGTVVEIFLRCAGG